MALITERYADFAQPLTDAIKANAEALAAAVGLTIREEVWVFSALEPCATYQLWHAKANHRTYLRFDDGKCLHYYFYFLEAELGLC